MTTASASRTKLTPNIADIIGLARAVKRGGGDGIVAINTVRGMAIDIELKKPVLYNRMGGYSGSAIKPIGVRAVYAICKEVEIPIIGCGGIATGADALEYIMAGASAVQIGTGVYTRGIDVFANVSSEISDYMKSHGISEIHELVGMAIK